MSKKLFHNVTINIYTKLSHINQWYNPCITVVMVITLVAICQLLGSRTGSTRDLNASLYASALSVQCIISSNYKKVLNEQLVHFKKPAPQYGIHTVAKVSFWFFELNDSSSKLFNTGHGRLRLFAPSGIHSSMNTKVLMILWNSV